MPFLLLKTAVFKDINPTRHYQHGLVDTRHLIHLNAKKY